MSGAQLDAPCDLARVGVQAEEIANQRRFSGRRPERLGVSQLRYSGHASLRRSRHRSEHEAELSAGPTVFVALHRPAGSPTDEARVSRDGRAAASSAHGRAAVASVELSQAETAGERPSSRMIARL